LRFSSTRALAKALRSTSESVGALGANEVAEGEMRLDIADDLAADSAQLAVQGEEQALAGAVAMTVGQLHTEAALAGAREGIAQIATGAADIGAAEALSSMAATVAERTELQ
jgi:hypothetical protein